MNKLCKHQFLQSEGWGENETVIKSLTRRKRGNEVVGIEHVHDAEKEHWEECGVVLISKLRTDRSSEAVVD